MTNAQKKISPRLLSVGHSNHNLERFVALLQQAGVTSVADVRSHPYSRYMPHFNQDELKTALQAHGISYHFLGELLGGRPEDLDLFDDDGRVDYERVRQTATFRRGLDHLCDMMITHITAMMCSEEDPLDCHRGLMITPALKEQDILPGHLRGNGDIESTPDMEQRLLDELRGADYFGGLFADQVTAEDREQELVQAYRDMARRKAFRLKGGKPKMEE